MIYFLDKFEKQTQASDMKKAAWFLILFFAIACGGTVDPGSHGACGAYSLDDMASGYLTCDPASAPTCVFDEHQSPVNIKETVSFVCSCGDTSGVSVYKCEAHQQDPGDLAACRVNNEPLIPQREVCGPGGIIVSCDQARPSFGGCQPDFLLPGPVSAVDWCC